VLADRGDLAVAGGPGRGDDAEGHGQGRDRQRGDYLHAGILLPEKKSNLRGRAGAVKRRARFAFPKIACYRPAAVMRLRALLPAALLLLPLAGCGATIASINARPDKYYQHKVKIVGRIERMQFLPHGALLEVADGQGRRLLVRSVDPIEAETGDWVRIEGVFVPEVNVEDATLYDVLAAERIVRRRAPRFLNIM